MGFASAEREHTWKQLRDYQAQLKAMANLAGEAAFHVKHGREREAGRAIKKLEGMATAMAAKGTET